MCTLMTLNICLVCHVQTLGLSNSNIGDAGLTALAKAVESGALASLETLDLGSNKIGDNGMKALADACASGALASLKKLDLAVNKISDDGLKALAEACASGALDKLTVRWCPTALSPCPETWNKHSPDSYLLFDVPCAET